METIENTTINSNRNKRQVRAQPSTITKMNESMTTNKNRDE
jgi:hypothetical protein